jgi:hypothetical protein
VEAPLEVRALREHERDDDVQRALHPPPTFEQTRDGRDDEDV